MLAPRFLLPLLLAVPALASTILDPLDAPASDVQAYRDAALAYPSVGVVSGSGFSGSGVLIGDRWVLTAGHVGQLKAGGTFTLGGISHTIESSLVHPGFSFAGPVNDIALLLLATSAGDVPAARMFQYSDTLAMIGSEAVWVGEGFTGTEGRSGAGSPIERRAFTNIIDAFGDHPDYEGLPASSFVADFDKPDGSTNAPASSPLPTALEGNLAPGDSGGGVFARIDGETYLIGIHSYRGTLDSLPAGTNSRYGAISGATHLQLFHQWISDNTGIVPVPEPAVPLLLALAAPLLIRRRR